MTDGQEMCGRKIVKIPLHNRLCIAIIAIVNQKINKIDRGGVPGGSLGSCDVHSQLRFFVSGSSETISATLRRTV